MRDRTKMKNILKTLLSCEEGATAAEYAIMASLIAVVIIGAVTLLGLNTSNLFQNVADKYPK
jgi:pilus assembly protein Flp/PilA